MQRKGKFILFALDEFGKWLTSTMFTRQIVLIQEHHTFIPSYKDFTGNNHFALCEEMEESHLKRGFSEIAQQLTTFPDGTVAVCRSFDIDPAGIKGANQGAICIENLGNFDLDADRMTDVQRQAIVRINALLCRRFGLQPSTDSIVYHHWYDRTTGLRTNGSGNTKTCPGTHFFSGNSVDAADAHFIALVKEAFGALPAL